MSEQVHLVAVVQDAPVLLDRDACVERACGRIKEASAAGARLVLFPEAFVPGYPDWVWRVPGWHDAPMRLALAEQAVVVGDDATERLAAAAAEGDAWVVVGVTERATESATLYNSLLYLAPDGSVAGCHRKLMPTGAERTVWGEGDGSTLHAFDSPFGRFGGLICWENLMPLARAAMYGQGVDVYLAPTWDNDDSWLSTLRHIAREGGVYVLGTNSCIRGSDVPRTLDALAQLYGGDDDWLSRGNAAIVAPDGSVLAGPLVGETGILYAPVDLAAVRAARSRFDVVGHYARPDVLRLVVDDAPHRPVQFTGSRSTHQ